MMYERNIDNNTWYIKAYSNILVPFKEYFTNIVAEEAEF